MGSAIEGGSQSSEHRGDGKTTRWAGRLTLRLKIVSAVCGIVLAGVAAYAATNWIVNLNAGSSGEGQSASISSLTISAVASPAATNLLYPGGTGDVVVTISNPNAFPVTVTSVQLPTNTTYATGSPPAP